MTLKLCPNSGCKNMRDSEAKQCRACYRREGAAKTEANAVRKTTDTIVSPAERVVVDRAKVKTAAELKDLKARYQESLKTIERQEAELSVVAELRDGLEVHSIRPERAAGSSEATAVMVASDWHIEERVGAEVGGLNEFNISIARERSQKFFRHALRLTDLMAKDIKISNVVLALLGDFISGDIHDELLETAELQPMHAIVEAQNLIVAGISYLLEHSDRKITIPCHSGNHARTTKTTRFAVENGHSLEYLMYVHLAAYFRSEKRVEFIIPKGPHSYLDIYGQTIRLQHGHMIKYGGGVGGIYIPTHKALAQWNKARHAHLDIFGHFHQQVDGGNFLCNGSLVGYNSFALSIKASYEKPRQTFFLLDKQRGRTITAPIIL